MHICVCEHVHALVHTQVRACMHACVCVCACARTNCHLATTPLPCTTPTLVTSTNSCSIRDCDSKRLRKAVCVRACVFACVCAHLHGCAPACVHTHVYACMYMPACARVCAVYAGIHVCVCARMCPCDRLTVCLCHGVSVCARSRAYVCVHTPCVCVHARVYACVHVRACACVFVYASLCVPVCARAWIGLSNRACTHACIFFACVGPCVCPHCGLWLSYATVHTCMCARELACVPRRLHALHDHHSRAC